MRTYQEEMIEELKEFISEDTKRSNAYARIVAAFASRISCYSEKYYDWDKFLEYCNTPCYKYNK